MPFIGNQPALSYTSFAKQDFTTSATTSYTLYHPVANANELALFINFVRQEPTTAYTASGTTLTLTSATSASDDMYCVYLGKAVQTVNPPSGSVGSSQVAASIITGQTAETSIATDDTILIHDTSASALRKMTRANFVSGIGGTNTPAFLAQKTTGTQTISNTTSTQVTFDNEVFDTNNNFASNTFTPTTAGKYYLYGQVGFSTFSDQALGILYIKQNSTLISEKWIRASSIHSFYFSTEIIAVANSGDNFIVEVYQDTGGSKDLITSSKGTYFYGYKIIE